MMMAGFSAGCQKHGPVCSDRKRRRLGHSIGRIIDSVEEQPNVSHVRVVHSDLLRKNGCPKYMKKSDLSQLVLKQMLQQTNIIRPIQLADGGTLWHIAHSQNYFTDRSLTQSIMFDVLRKNGIISDAKVMSVTVTGPAKTVCITVDQSSTRIELKALLHIMKSVHADQ